MAQTKKALFPFLPLDYKAAEGWLNEQAQQGWELTSLSMLQTARFRRAEHPRQYAVVLWQLPNVAGAQQDAFEDYKAFLASCGWEYVSSQSMLHVFASQPGESLPPLETDPAAEAMQIRKHYVRQVLTGWLVLLLYALFIWLMLRSGEQTWALSLSSNLMVASIPFFAIMAVILLLQVTRLLVWLPKLRAAEKRGVPLPRRSAALAYRQGLWEAGGILVAILLIFAALFADTAYSFSNIRYLMQIAFIVSLSLAISINTKGKYSRQLAGVLTGVTLIGWLASANMSQPPVDEARLAQSPALSGVVQQANYRFLEVAKSPLLSYVEYAESGDGSIVSYCVDAATPALADAAFHDLIYRFSTYFYARQQLGLQSISLPGMDVALFYEYDGYQMLALRRGKRIVRVECGADYSRPGAPVIPPARSLANADMQQRILATFFSEL